MRLKEALTNSLLMFVAATCAVLIVRALPQAQPTAQALAGSSSESNDAAAQRTGGGGPTLAMQDGIKVYRFTTQHIIHALGTRVGGERHFLTAPPGSVMLFAVVFVVVWFSVSLILVVPWFLWIQDK